MIIPSSFTNTRSVSECLSYPIITDLESSTADYPFHTFQYSSFTLLPLGSAINRVPQQSFLHWVVVNALGTSRHQGISQINQ